MIERNAYLNENRKCVQLRNFKNRLTFAKTLTKLLIQSNRSNPLIWETAMPIDPFVLIVADHDNRQFSVEGPMIDDNPWSKPVVDAQEDGKRRVTCFVPGGAARTDARIAAREYIREYGYSQVPSGSIVSLPLP